MARLKVAASLTLLALVAWTAEASAQSAPLHQITVAVDPKSTADAQSHLIAKGFQYSCPNVSIIRDESQADYVVLASNSDGLRGFLLHYYITIYDKQGKVVFATDKHHGKDASKDACRFLNRQ